MKEENDIDPTDFAEYQVFQRITKFIEVKVNNKVKVILVKVDEIKKI